MAKHILADVCDCKRGGEIFLVSPDIIEVQEGWNARTDFSGEEELMAYIAENGVPGVLEVLKTADKQLHLVDGERRLRAVRKLNDAGSEIKAVPVVVAKKGTSEIDLYLSHMTRNAGKPFTATEEASCFKRLTGWGFTVVDISKKTGKSQTHVRNRLELAEAGPDVQAAVNAGEISAKDAQQIVKISDGKVDTQRDELEKAKAKPRRNKLILSLRKGNLKYTGITDAPCAPLEDIFSDARLLDTLELFGYNPETLRISIERAESEVADEEE